MPQPPQPPKLKLKPGPKPKIKVPPTITIALRSIKCLEETDEVGADEPYVLVAAADLKKLVPQVEVTRYGPWKDVDKGETKSTMSIPKGFPQSQIDLMKQLAVLRIPFWGLDNKSAKKIANADDVIFIVSMMEHDDGKPEAARGLVKAGMISSLAGSVGMGRDDRVAKVIADVKSALKIPTGAPNFDDHIGTKELRLTTKDLLLPHQGSHSRTLFFLGDGGHYKTVFDLVKA